MINIAELNIKTKKIRSVKRTTLISKIIIFILLSMLSLIILIPFAVVVFTSLKTTGESMGPFSWVFNEGVSVDGYKAVLAPGMVPSIGKGFINTFIIVIPASIVGLLASAISAYAFAKGKFPLKKVLFGALLMTMMIPSVIMLAPSYLIYNMLGLTDTFFPLIVPGMFGAAACVFFMRQFYYGIPTELMEAAKIDGCNHFRIFFQIMVPLSKSALIAQLVLGFLGGYNDYFAPTLYLAGNPELSTLQMVLGRLQSTWGGEWNVVMAGAVITLVPTIILYFIAQKYFIEGIATSGMKI